MQTFPLLLVMLTPVFLTFVIFRIQLVFRWGDKELEQTFSYKYDSVIPIWRRVEELGISPTPSQLIFDFRVWTYEQAYGDKARIKRGLQPRDRKQQQ